MYSFLVNINAPPIHSDCLWATPKLIISRLLDFYKHWWLLHLFFSGLTNTNTYLIHSDCVWPVPMLIPFILHVFDQHQCSYYFLRFFLHFYALIVIPMFIPTLLFVFDQHQKILGKSMHIEQHKCILYTIIVCVKVRNYYFPSTNTYFCKKVSASYQRIPHEL